MYGYVLFKDLELKDASHPFLEPEEIIRIERYIQMGRQMFLVGRQRSDAELERLCKRWRARDPQSDILPNYRPIQYANFAHQRDSILLEGKGCRCIVDRLYRSEEHTSELQSLRHL